MVLAERLSVKFVISHWSVSIRLLLVKLVGLRSVYRSQIMLHGTAVGSPVSVVCCRRNCNTWRNAPLQLALKRYRFGYARLRTLLPPFKKTKLRLLMITLANRTPTSSLQRNRRKRKKNFSSFSRLLGKPRQPQTANDSAQKTNAYRQIT